MLPTIDLWQRESKTEESQKKKNQAAKCWTRITSLKADQLTMGITLPCLNIWNFPMAVPSEEREERQTRDDIQRVKRAVAVTKRATAGGPQMPGDYGVYPPTGYWSYCARRTCGAKPRLRMLPDPQEWYILHTRLHLDPHILRHTCDIFWLISFYFGFSVSTN